MKTVKQFRWIVMRDRELYSPCGFGIWFRRGSTGTTYGEMGTNEFLRITLLLGPFSYSLRCNWKLVKPAEAVDP